jgi:PIN domain nuclease of toxin-antitoxin system
MRRRTTASSKSSNAEAMRYLIDTECWLWLQAEPERFSESTLELLANRHNEIFLSAGSVWEIVIKYGLGQLRLPVPPDEYVPSRMQQTGTTGLPVTHLHAVSVGRLPAHHSDHFDRLLIAQAQCEALRVVTANEAFKLYDINIQPP